MQTAPAPPTAAADGRRLRHHHADHQRDRLELVGGTPITDHCDGNKLPIRDRLDLFLQVCAAVQHAHPEGVIHRDLKPSNELVTVHDVDPVAKVIDFGVGKAVGRALTDKAVYTPLAPESVRGVGYDELRRLIREDEPARPSARLGTLAAAARSTVADRPGADPRPLPEQVRGELDWIAMKCLEKDRNRR